MHCVFWILRGLAKQGCAKCWLHNPLQSPDLLNYVFSVLLIISLPLQHKHVTLIVHLLMSSRSNRSATMNNYLRATPTCERSKYTKQSQKVFLPTLCTLQQLLYSLCIILLLYPNLDSTHLDTQTRSSKCKQNFISHFKYLDRKATLSQICLQKTSPTYIDYVTLALQVTTFRHLQQEQALAK